MATSPCTGGYDQDFLELPAKLKEFECPLCLFVTREPNLSSCCGQHFCQSCINRVITDRKPCPFCNSANYTVFLDKKQKRKVLGLTVCCSVKARGCSWTGKLGELGAHTDTQIGDCQFVDVACPNSCGESPQRCHMGSHLSGTCPKRPFSCEHCNFKSTYKEVCKHYSECTKFPVPCPNKCQAPVQQERMSEHLNECPLQLVECEYGNDGCKMIQRKDAAMHIMQTHLLPAFTSCQKQNQELQRMIEELQREKDEQIKGIQTLVEGIRREKDEKLKEKDQQIERLQWRVAMLEKRLPVLEFTLSNYSEISRRLVSIVDFSAFYTHSRGAKMVLILASQIPTLKAALIQVPGEFDHEIQWPVKCTVIIHLLNQLGDHSHITARDTVSLYRPRDITLPVNPLVVEHSKIEDRSKIVIQYLKDDCIKFRVYVEPT